MSPIRSKTYTVYLFDIEWYKFIRIVT